MAFVSDITKFLNDYKKEHPHTEQRQREGRARLWDKNIDTDQQADFKAARVAQKPYVYGSQD